jgi:hypothetical protein
VRTPDAYGDRWGYLTETRVIGGYPPGLAEGIELVPLKLWKADAIVLFDWLMSLDFNAIPITHKAEKQALTDLLARLEETEVCSASQAEIDEARHMVSKDMGW